MKAILFFFGLVISCLTANAQPAFYTDILHFKQEDSLHFPPENAILFVGSSSFTKWTDVQDYFPGYTIINRGFGGSSLPDVMRYANDIIFPYHPRQVVIYCGENDFASSDTLSALTVFNRFRRLFVMIRTKMPGVPVFYISMKPSPSRQHLKAKMMAANNLIKKFISKKSKAGFIDVYPKMLGTNGRPLADIYLQDSLHMNAKGYQIWQKIIQPYLLK